MNKVSFIIIAAVIVGCNSSAQDTKKPNAENFKVSKSDSEWKDQLTSEEYRVLRTEGTEAPFSSELNKKYGPGTYVCAGCGTPVFEGAHKFDSGTGWPSFDRAVEGNVAYSTDNSMFYARTEEHCAVCGGHLGHVFDDGPRETTGKRHCINGVALNYKPTDGKSE